MTTLSASQVAQYAKQAMIGAPTGDVVIMVAIALCESGGNTESTNPNCPNATCYGLWQMNEGFGTRLYNPAVAAKHMADTYRISHFRYWGCGPDHVGGYRNHMAEAQAAVGSATDKQPSQRCLDNCKDSMKQYGIPYETCLQECEPGFVVTSDTSGQAGTTVGGLTWSGGDVKLRRYCRTDLHKSTDQINDCVGEAKAACLQAGINRAGPCVTYLQTGQGSPYGDQGFTVPLGGAGGIANMPFGGVFPGLFDSIKDVGSATAALAKALLWLVDPGHWVRVAEFLGGILLVIIAFYVLIGGKGERSAAVPVAAKQAAKLEAVA